MNTSGMNNAPMVSRPVAGILSISFTLPVAPSMNIAKLAVPIAAIPARIERDFTSLSATMENLFTWFKRKVVF